MSGLRYEGKVGQEGGSRQKEQYEQSPGHIQKLAEVHCDWCAESGLGMQCGQVGREGDM